MLKLLSTIRQVFWKELWINLKHLQKDLNHNQTMFYINPVWPWVGYFIWAVILVISQLLPQAAICGNMYSTIPATVWSTLIPAVIITRYLISLGILALWSLPWSLYVPLCNLLVLTRSESFSAENECVSVEGGRISSGRGFFKRYLRTILFILVLGIKVVSSCKFSLYSTLLNVWG
jgi:hypothetical protein